MSLIANSTNPDEMPGYEAFHLGLHLFAGFPQLSSIQRVHIYMCLLCMLEQLSCCLHMQNGLAFTAVLAQFWKNAGQLALSQVGPSQVGPIINRPGHILPTFS